MSINQITDENYQILLTKAVSSFGNHYRIKKALDKARNENVNIAFLGGSVTNGYNPAGYISENYIKLICSYINEKYCDSGNCSYVNTGIPGTCSMHGLVLTEMKVRESYPDIVFVEYAINNGLNRTYITVFESLIYKLLTMESKPAVIPIILCNAEFYSCSSYMEIIAKHYDLPVINVYHLIHFGLEHNMMEWGNYSNDYGHPTKEGHKLIADCIIHLFDHISEQDSHYHVPEKACYSREYHNLKYLDHYKLIPDENCEFMPAETIQDYPRGWNHVMNGLNPSFKFRTTCKALFILYEQSNSPEFGTVEIYDNNKLILSLEGYSITAWGNPYITLVMNEDKEDIHQIEIRMYHEDENKKFSILGFGIVL